MSDAFLSDDEIARAVGLSEWRLGSHARWPEIEAGHMWVHYLWRIAAEPSFDEPWIVAATIADVKEKDWTKAEGRLNMAAEVDEENTGLLVRKAFLAIPGESISLTIPSDPVVEAINQAQFLRLPRFETLDGICYDLRFETTSVQAEISLANPQGPTLRALELAFFRIAEELAQASGAKWAAAVMGTWSHYIR